MKKKLLAVLCATGLLTAALTGCGNSEAQTTSTTETTEQTETTVAETQGTEDTQATEETETEDTANLSGTISLAGSTSMEKLCEAMSESFMEKYPGITVTVEYTGSGAGLESLASGSVDIGNSSRHLKDEELSGGAVENVVAIDGIAVIEDKDNTVTDIKAEDLAKIYTVDISN